MPPLRNKNGRFSTRGMLNRQEKGLSNGKNNQGRIVPQSGDDNLNKTFVSGETISYNTRRQLGLSMENIQAMHTMDVNPVVGDRIINLQHIEKQMFCQFCNTKLEIFGNIKKEAIRGLGSLWLVNCQNCHKTKQIETSKRYKSLVSGREHFEVNVKAVLGKILMVIFVEIFFKKCLILGALHNGLGHTHINNVLKIVNLPGMANGTFKRVERETGKIIEKISKQKCVANHQEERRLTILNNDKLLSLL